MKTVYIKTTGLILFILGFCFFTAVFFIGDYSLKNVNLQKHFSDKEKSVLYSQLHSEQINKIYAGPFSFINDLNKSFEEFNKTVINRYSIQEDAINAFLNSSSFPLKLNFQDLKREVIEGPNKDYQSEKFDAYASWMDNRKYETKEQLEKDLFGVLDNIEKYSIIKEKGIDKYRKKSLLFSLSKDANQSIVKSNNLLVILLTYGLCILGAMLYILPRMKELPGIKNNGVFHRSMTNVGWLGVLTGSFLILFYVVLYFYPEYMTSWIIMVDPISIFLKNSEAGRFFLYGFLYTLCILIMGVRMILKYRHSKYHLIRTLSVMFFQLAFAFLIPEILLRLNQPYFDFKNIWPLDYDFFFGNELSTLIESGALGLFMLVWGIALILVAVPVFVFFFGKRWYCSWVCGCGGLAETLGDPYRQLSDKSLRAWKIERWTIHGILVFAVFMTTLVLYTFFTGESEILGLNSFQVREVYGAWIGAGFAGVVGTGFYPLMGNRVWCRFGCPLAAYLGIIQKFKSRFRITTNGGQCISCGNCSTYCEMGIDVRWYAQRGQNIIRASCVGCGVCSSVCPRGVLNLEVKNEEGRYNNPILIGLKDIEIKS